MTEQQALDAVIAAGRAVSGTQQSIRTFFDRVRTLSDALAALDKVRNEATERDAKCVHAFQERLPSGEILASCGLTVPYAEVCLGRSGVRCPGCQESYRGKYCPGGHPGTSCLPSCWGYVMPGDLPAGPPCTFCNGAGTKVVGDVAIICDCPSTDKRGGPSA